MIDRVVIDASVALAYLLTESGTPAAKAAVGGWRLSETELLVPSHFWLEVTNTLVRGHTQSPADLVEDFINLDDLGLTTVEPDRPLLLLTIDQMLRSGLSAYDAIYLALALSTNARLATLDRRLAEAAGESGLLIDSEKPHRLAEQRVGYRVDRPDYSGWTHNALVGAHIAELRRKAIAGTS